MTTHVLQTLPPLAVAAQQPATIDPTLDLCIRYPLWLGGPRQSGIQSLPDTPTHSQHWESNTRPSDPESNALSTWPHALTYYMLFPQAVYCNYIELQCVCKNLLYIRYCSMLRQMLWLNFWVSIAIVYHYIMLSIFPCVCIAIISMVSLLCTQFHGLHKKILFAGSPSEEKIYMRYS